MTEAAPDAPLKVLLSAYACEPGKGSEPGVGWHWACGLAPRVRLSVLTRANNRPIIEKTRENLSEDNPLQTVRFLYYDLPKPFLLLKRQWPMPYYILWQWMAARRFRSLAGEHDVVHHLTFCTLLCPGFWKLRHPAFIIGPTGAPLVNPHYMPLFGNKAWLQRLRGILILWFLRLPWLRRLLKSAAAIVPANSETHGLLMSQGLSAHDVILDTGTPDVPGHLPDQSRKNNVCRFVFAGRLERRKGIELSLRAFAKATGKEKFHGTFEIIGDGPDRERLDGLVADLGLRDRVAFTGPVDRDEVIRRFLIADVFLFSSARDTSAGVNLEAMACGLPVVCLSHQGVSDITTDACALRVPPGPIAKTIDKLAEAISNISSDPVLRRKLGDEAQRRAREDFSWDDKFDRMLGIYRNATTSGPELQ